MSNWIYWSPFPHFTCICSRRNWSRHQRYAHPFNLISILTNTEHRTCKLAWISFNFCAIHHLFLTKRSLKALESFGELWTCSLHASLCSHGIIDRKHNKIYYAWSFDPHVTLFESSNYLDHSYSIGNFMMEIRILIMSQSEYNRE